MSQVKGYAEHTLIRCAPCGEHARLPHEVTHDQVPLILVCPSCGEGTRWRKLPILPKIQTSQTDFKYFEVSREAAATPVISQEKQEEIAELLGDDGEVPIVPFWQLANDLGENIEAMIEGVNALKKEIDKFAEQLIPYFKSEYKYATVFNEHYRTKYMGEFLKNPFTVVTINCKDDLATQYSRWIISPKFYDPRLGIKVRTTGGMRLELMNQYTRMNNTDLNYKLCEELKLPPTLDLRVQENKIIGGSLPMCWKDIPGIAEDKDSNEEWRSVYIRDSYQARQWLARHGVPAWEASTFTPENLNTRRLDDELSSVPLFINAWKKFLHSGRMGIFWSNIPESRKFAANVAMMVKGITPVFVSGEKDEINWKGIYGSGTTMHREAVFFKNGEFPAWDTIYRTRMIIVDMHGELDSEVLTRLYGYKGKLLLISNDPFMDFQGENILASLVYGLLNTSIHDVASWEKWDGGTVGAVSEAIADGMADLKDVRIKKMRHSRWY